MRVEQDFIEIVVTPSFPSMRLWQMLSLWFPSFMIFRSVSVTSVSWYTPVSFLALTDLGTTQNSRALEATHYS